MPEIEAKRRQRRHQSGREATGHVPQSPRPTASAIVAKGASISYGPYQISTAVGAHNWLLGVDPHSIISQVDKQWEGELNRVQPASSHLELYKRTSPIKGTDECMQFSVGS